MGLKWWIFRRKHKALFGFDIAFLLAAHEKTKTELF